MFYDFLNVCVDDTNNYAITSSTDPFGIGTPTCTPGTGTPTILSKLSGNDNLNLAISKVINTGNLENLPGVSYFNNPSNRQKFESAIKSNVVKSICSQN